MSNHSRGQSLRRPKLRRTNSYFFQPLKRKKMRQKISLANIAGQLSRLEMKNITGGSGPGGGANYGFQCCSGSGYCDACGGGVRNCGGGILVNCGY
jgi:hypothetical protein